MNRRVNVILMMGVLLPLALAVVIGTVCGIGYQRVRAEWQARKMTYDIMVQQKSDLETGRNDLALIAEWLPRMRAWHGEQVAAEFGTFLSSRCTDANGVRLSGTSQSALASYYTKKGGAQTFTLFGRSGAMVKVLGEARRAYPAVRIDSWSATRQPKSEVVHFSLTAVHLNEPE